MYRKYLLLLALLAALLLFGCAGRVGTGGSFVGKLPVDPAASIANDATDQLISLYPPGRTTVFLTTPHKANDAFSTAFEASLRSKGFTLVTSPTGGENALTVAYVVDRVSSADKADKSEGDGWYIQLKVNNGETVYAYARLYNEAGIPEAGRSVVALKDKDLPVSAAIKSTIASAFGE